MFPSEKCFQVNYYRSRKSGEFGNESIFQENPNQGKKRNALERKRAKTDIADTDEVQSSDEVYIYDLSNFCWELLEKDAQLSSKEFVLICKEYI